MKNQNNGFFCVCPKCENKIYKHLGSMEYPKGKYLLNVKCDSCSFEFQHIIMSDKAFKRQQMEAIGNNIGMKNITEMAQSFVKGAFSKKNEANKYLIKKKKGDDGGG